MDKEDIKEVVEEEKVEPLEVVIKEKPKNLSVYDSKDAIEYHDQIDVKEMLDDEDYE